MAGFAFAEQLSGQLSQLEKQGPSKSEQSTGKLIEAIDIAQAERFADHPEVNLQIGRLLQAFAGETIASKLNWPANVNSSDKKTLSEPANIAAAYRSAGDPRMSTLRDLTKELPQQIEALRRSALRMAAAASVCSFDWRSELGVLRSDLNWFSPEVRCRNYARLLLVTGQSQQVPASIGSAALLAGEKEVGYRFLHDYLERIPKQVVAVASSIVNQLPASISPAEAVQELQLVLPKSLLSQTELAEDFSRKPGRELISEQLAKKIDHEALELEAAQQSKIRQDSRPWLLVAWLAKVRKDPTTQIEALSNATKVDQMNHKVRFELAQILWQNGLKSEAEQEAKRANQQAPDVREYKDFLKKIQNVN